VGARGKTDYESVPARDGDVLDLGRLRIRVLETPGHTPESICLLVFDRDRSENQPYAVLTGDTLFLGDVGRPDLAASGGERVEDLAGMLYDSIHGKILPLPDATLVYPAHGAGSLCGKSLSTESCTTLGVQRRTNYALSGMPKAEFVRLVTADQPETPRYFGYDADLNRRRRAVLEDALPKALRPLSPDEVLRLSDDGATVLDARSQAEFAAGHLAGAINVPLSGRYATWAGAVVPREEPIVLVAPAGKEAEAAMRLMRIGFDDVVGFLEGGIAATASLPPSRIRRTRRETAAQLRARLASPNPPTVVDVRAASEWAQGHVEGSRNVPLQRLRERAAEVPRDRDVVIHCQSGYRSAVAVSVLEREGWDRLADLVGGWQAWEALSLPAKA
jgi:hydroxyacylglutathione hydrolase